MSRTFRVCILGNARSPHVRRLATALAALHVDVHIVCSGAGDPLGPGVEVHDLGSWSTGPTADSSTTPIWIACPRALIRRFSPTLAALLGDVLIVRRGVRRKVRSIAPDIVYAQYVTSAGLWTLVLGRPIALAAWGSDILVDCRHSRLTRALARVALRRAAVVSYDSDDVRAELLTLGVPETRLVRLDFGVDRAELDVEPVAPSQRDPTVIAFRSLERESYRVRETVVAFAAVAAEMSDARLVVANDGVLRPALERLAGDLGIVERVRFIGKVPHAEVIALLRTARVYVSIPESDGTSATLLEALAAGCFPVVSDLPANREWVRDRTTGRVVDGADSSAVGAAILDGLGRDDLDAIADSNRDLIRTRGVFEENVAVVMAHLAGVTR